MVLVTSLGCGESWAYLSDRAKAAFGQAVREKSLAETGRFQPRFNETVNLVIKVGGFCQFCDVRGDIGPHDQTVDLCCLA